VETAKVSFLSVFYMMRNHPNLKDAKHKRMNEQTNKNVAAVAAAHEKRELWKLK
jgi:hypothetical protein